MVATPISSRASLTDDLCILVNILLNALPITEPPRAVICCTLVTAANNSSKLTFAPWAVDPALARAFAKSSVLTAKAASTVASLLTSSVVVNAVEPKLFTAAVKVSTDFAASIPDNLVRIIASFIRLRVSSAPKPCRDNSTAASDTDSNACPVFFATSNKSSEN